MDLGGIPLFQAIGKRLSWLTERQNLLAQNVANADTPGYVSQDLAPQSFRDLIAGRARHLGLSAASGASLAGAHPGGAFTAVADPAAERKLSGNAVDLEGEMMKVADTAADYSLVTNLYRKQLGMLKTALGHGGG